VTKGKDAHISLYIVPNSYEIVLFSVFQSLKEKGRLTGYFFGLLGQDRLPWMWGKTPSNKM
jgi:hypothetical protein